jgi:pimeloyl-ACP methyl ester carboxylesterase
MKTHIVKTQDGQKIAFDHYENGHDKVVIIAHGFFNSKDAVLLKDLGHELGNEYDVIIMDFRGHGKSGGLFYWTSKEYLDLEAVLEYAKKSYGKIGLIGFSLGAATSMITASRAAFRDHVSSLIAVSGPSEFWKIEYRFWEIDVENDILYNWFGRGKAGKRVLPGPFWQKKDRPIDCAAKIKCPVFYIHGEADWLIKPWHSEAQFKNTKSKKKLAVIKNGPHAEYLMRSSKNKAETVGLIKDWFKETLSEK